MAVAGLGVELLRLVPFQRFLCVTRQTMVRAGRDLVGVETAADSVAFVEYLFILLLEILVLTAGTHL